MPIYEYQCPKCNQLWDVLCRFEDQPPSCPSCGNPKTTRKISPPKGIHGGDYNPFDALSRSIPDGKRIKSFANDRRKGGKDTT
jgi:putative FmdB family regulatory protein